MSAYRQTWGGIKNQVGIPIGMCGTDADLRPRVNEASELLWAEGEWAGHFVRYKFRVTCCSRGNRIITWPKEIETIEALEACGTPIGVRNVYFEFIENAVGNLDRSSGNYGLGYGPWGRGSRAGTLLGDRQEVCTMEEVNPYAKRIKAYSSLPADDGTQIILMGYDDSANWIRTQQNGVYVDGEYLTLNSYNPPQTVNFFSSITGVQFSTTPRNGDITITEVDTLNSNSERFLSTFSYSEAIPIYRRSVLTGFGNESCATVTALCRLRFMPIVADTDYLQIGNLSALKDMLISLQKRDNGKVQEAEEFRMRAIRSLNNELRSFQGVGPRKIVSAMRRDLWSVGTNLR